MKIQKNNFYSKIWLKKGKIHDEQREEIEVKFKREDFEKSENLFLPLGFAVKIKWFGRRNNFRWKDVDASIDFTKGYGYIIKLEKMVNKEEKEAILLDLKEKLSQLGINQTSREEFDKNFSYYKENWQELIKN